jgi:hypothetical protein
MLAEFPEFRPLRLGDRAAVQALTRRFQPYSDFNFTSLYSWDTNESVLVSVLNGNLAVRFIDYTTQEPFYSFLGDQAVDDTAQRLLALAKAEGIVAELRLVPEVTAWRLSPGLLELSEDESNCDYILGIEKMKTFQGNKLGPKRNFVNRFQKSYEAATVRVDLGDIGIQTRFLDLYHRWLIQKGAAAENPENELLALHRVMFAARHLPDLFVVATFIGDDLAGFSINELAGSGYGMIHFEKADSGYTGIYAQLMQQMAGLMELRGCRYINYEQDLGIPGLRKGKSSYVPSHYLKKYVLRERRASERPSDSSRSDALAPYLFLAQTKPGDDAWNAPPMDASDFTDSRRSWEVNELHVPGERSSVLPESPSSAEDAERASSNPPLRYSIPPSEANIGVNLAPLYVGWTELYDSAIAARTNDSIPPPPATPRGPVRERPLGGALDVKDEGPQSFRPSVVPPRPTSIPPPPPSEPERTSQLPGSLSFRAPPVPRISVFPEPREIGRITPVPRAASGRSSILPPRPDYAGLSRISEPVAPRSAGRRTPIPREEPQSSDREAVLPDAAVIPPPPPRPRLQLDGGGYTPRSAPPARPADFEPQAGDRSSISTGVIGLRLRELNLNSWLDGDPASGPTERRASRPVSFSRTDAPPSSEEPIPDTRPSEPNSKEPRGQDRISED